MTGIQTGQAIEEYTLRLGSDGQATFDSTFGVSLETEAGKQVSLRKGTVLIVRSVRWVMPGWVEVRLIAQDHLHAIAVGLLAD